MHAGVTRRFVTHDELRNPAEAQPGRRDEVARGRVHCLFAAYEAELNLGCSSC